MSLATQFGAASSVDFQRRVAAALWAGAITVYTELNTTPGHAARAAYALQVVQNPPLGMVTINAAGITAPDKLVYAWTVILAAQGLDNSAADAAISAAVLAGWNAMAGV